MKYIGPFLRMNSLKKEDIQNQLFYLSKESIKHIVLYSKCGICVPLKELDTKKSSNFDINIFKGISPLLCIYKKANPKLLNLENKLCWNEEKFKKEINILGNAFMTICLLELSEYYSDFNNIDNNLYSQSKLYLVIAKKQLEFYASYFRNEEGVFVDKTDKTDSMNIELKFEEKNKSFKFSDQAFVMAAYYKYSCMANDQYSESYKNFSLDILKMFIKFREDLYDLNREELIKLCLGLNLFCAYSNNRDAKILLLDLCELIREKNNEENETINDKKLEYDCLTYIDYILFYKNTGLTKFNEECEKICSKLIELYNPDSSIFDLSYDKRNIIYMCTDIMLYLLTLIIHSKINWEDTNNIIISDVFKHQVVNSGIIMSWPDAPDLKSRERYKNYSLKAEDLLDEQQFKMPSIPSPENSEVAPVFLKSVTYNRKKAEFSDSKTTFDSNKNMLIFLIVLNLLKPKFRKTKTLNIENMYSDSIQEITQQINKSS